LSLKGVEMRKSRKSEIEKFIALPDAEKERLIRNFDAETAEQSVARSRPLDAKERKQWRRFKAKMGRPKVGKGAKTISLTVERELLKRADTYAKRHGMSRARLVAEGLRAMIGRAA
jgi:hypothetical protein